MTEHTTQLVQIMGISVDPWILYTAILVTIGTIVAILALIRDIWKSKPKVRLKVSPSVSEGTEKVSATFEIKIINHLPWSINVNRILLIGPSDVGFNLSSCFRLPRIVPGKDSSTFTLDKPEVMASLKGKSYKYVSITDTADNFYQDRIPKSVTKMFLS